ncbi:hypothetical protein JD844_011474 [Phrynosoma platyrhinos]|uniref:Uncharacterized protein n=1 Tax=Phrynosoma platyrhinos TaxID=52577 RepID=A0ABQ7TI44_PHRPL|nr:hypothetical protein JD844_011474 [Phrynosoma platyrhinos]
MSASCCSWSLALGLQKPRWVGEQLCACRPLAKELVLIALPMGRDSVLSGLLPPVGSCISPISCVLTLLPLSMLKPNSVTTFAGRGWWWGGLQWASLLVDKERGEILLKSFLYLTLDSKVQCWSHLSIFTVK